MLEAPVPDEEAEVLLENGLGVLPLMQGAGGRDIHPKSTHGVLIRVIRKDPLRESCLRVTIHYRSPVLFVSLWPSQISITQFMFTVKGWGLLPMHQRLMSSVVSKPQPCVHLLGAP